MDLLHFENVYLSFVLRYRDHNVFDNCDLPLSSRCQELRASAHIISQNG